MEIKARRRGCFLRSAAILAGLLFNYQINHLRARPIRHYHCYLPTDYSIACFRRFRERPRLNKRAVRLLGLLI